MCHYNNVRTFNCLVHLYAHQMYVCSLACVLRVYTVIKELDWVGLTSWWICTLPTHNICAYPLKLWYQTCNTDLDSVEHVSKKTDQRHCVGRWNNDPLSVVMDYLLCCYICQSRSTYGIPCTRLMHYRLDPQTMFNHFHGPNTPVFGGSKVSTYMLLHRQLDTTSEYGYAGDHI
jgi:hypothetical protein